MCGLTSWSRSHFSGALVSAKFILQVYYLWSWLDSALVWFEDGHQIYWVWEPLGSISGANQGHLTLVLSLGPLGRSYKVICCWLPLVLGLEVLGRGWSVNGGWLILVPGLEPSGEHRDVSWGQLPLVPGLWPLDEATFQVKFDCCLGQAWGHLIGLTMQAEFGCCLCCTWGCLARIMRHAKSSRCLFQVYGPLRDFGKVHSMSWGKPLVWSSCEALQLGGQVGCGGVSGNHQGWANSVSHVNGELRYSAYLHQAGWVGGGLNKGTMVPARTSLPRELFWPLPLQHLPWSSSI